MCCELPIDTSDISAIAAVNSNASIVLQRVVCCSIIGQGSPTQVTPQEPPEAESPGTGFDSSIVPEEAQTRIKVGTEALSTDTVQLQHPSAPVEHHTSDEGVSHFDDDGDDDDAQQNYTLHDEARQSVGVGRMSALQASLPVGVSMTVESSQ